MKKNPNPLYKVGQFIYCDESIGIVLDASYERKKFTSDKTYFYKVLWAVDHSDPPWLVADPTINYSEDEMFTFVKDYEELAKGCLNEKVKLKNSQSR